MGQMFVWVICVSVISLAAAGGPPNLLNMLNNFNPLNPGNTAAVKELVSPLILVPGLAGSRLAAEMHGKVNRPDEVCITDRAKHLIWPPISGLLFFDCWADKVKLHYNESTGEVHDTPGLNIWAAGFGRTDKNEHLLDLKVSAVEYFGPMVDIAVNHWGYSRANSVRVASYDFRKITPDYIEQHYAPKMKELIEDTYNINNEKPVTVLCHSLGCIVTLRFFQLQDQNWKQKFIKQYVVVGAPYGGSTASAHAIVSGVKFFPHFDALKMRDVERSWPSFHLLMPNPKLFDYPLINTPSRTYKTSEVSDLYSDVASEYWNLYETSMRNYDPLAGPGVETHCLAGTDVDTPHTLVYGRYRNRFPNEQPEHMIMRDGDGTVLTESIGLCKRWKESQKEPIHWHGYSNATHIGLLKDYRLLEYLYKVLFPGRVTRENDPVPGVRRPFSLGDRFLAAAAPILLDPKLAVLFS